MDIHRAELSDGQDCFYNDEGINQMRIQVLRLHMTDFLLSKYNYQVVDIAPYHGHEKKLIDDINEVKIVKSFFNEIFSFKIFPQFNPAIIILAYCFSANSDVSMLLRRCGLFSIMVISHDLKMLTNNPKAELNEIQRDLMELIGNYYKSQAKPRIL